MISFSIILRLIKQIELSDKLLRYLKFSEKPCKFVKFYCFLKDFKRMTDPGISAAILAGGTATRFGGAIKSNLVIDGRDILSRIMDAISGIFNEIIIVTNNPAQFGHFDDKKIVSDIFSGIGPLGGIHAALSASSSDAVFIFAGDMPLLCPDIIYEQVELFKEKQPDVLIPRIGDYIEPLHSVYKRSILASLEDYIVNNTDKAVWRFIDTIHVDYFEPEDEIAAANSFISINSPADADFVEKIIQKLQ
jgi:molybdopterin-guanine dinucleotide biosynthesis protein A